MSALLDRRLWPLATGIAGFVSGVMVWQYRELIMAVARDTVSLFFATVVLVILTMILLVTEVKRRERYVIVI